MVHCAAALKDLNIAMVAVGVLIRTSMWTGCKPEQLEDAYDLYIFRRHTGGHTGDYNTTGAYYKIKTVELRNSRDMIFMDHVSSSVCVLCGGCVQLLCF